MPATDLAASDHMEISRLRSFVKRVLREKTIQSGFDFDEERKFGSVIDLLEEVYTIASGFACSQLGRLADTLEQIELSRCHSDKEEDNAFWPTLCEAARSISSKGSEVYIILMLPGGKVETPSQSAQRIYTELIRRRVPKTIDPDVFRERVQTHGITLQDVTPEDTQDLDIDKDEFLVIEPNVAPPSQAVTAAPMKAEPRPKADAQPPRPKKERPRPISIAGSGNSAGERTTLGDIFGDSLKLAIADRNTAASSSSDE